MVAGDQSSQYLGKEYDLYEIEVMSADEINKLYRIYEAGIIHC